MKPQTRGFDKMKALYNLNYEEFEDLVEKDLRIANWLVYDDGAVSRKNMISDKSYFKTLRQRADEQGIRASDEEVLSWLDTLNLLFHSLKNVNERILDRLQIIQEYQIPFTKRRADYLLVYENKILIIEFSFDKLGNEYKFENKLSQAIHYKELLSNIMPNHIKIGTYTFMISPEVDREGGDIMSYNKYTQQDELANSEKMIDLSEYIMFFFSGSSDAMMHLGVVDGYEQSIADMINDSDDEA